MFVQVIEMKKIDWNGSGLEWNVEIVSMILKED